MNETIATLASLNIPETGLEELELSDFKPTLQERISASVIEQLVDHCKALKVLEISSMYGDSPKPMKL